MEDIEEFSNLDSLPSSSSATKESADFKFVRGIEEYGKVLLTKSNTPQTKILKKQAAEKVRQKLLLNGGEDMKEEQIIKKVANIKQKVKAKADLKRTGNLPIKLKPSEQLFLNLLSAEDNPTITPLKCGLEVGIHSEKVKNAVIIENINLSNNPTPVSTIRSNPSTSDAALKNFPVKKIKFNDENNINTMQREVLKEQLNLIQMEIDMKHNEHQETMKILQQKNDHYNLKKEILILKKRVLENQLDTNVCVYQSL